MSAFGIASAVVLDSGQLLSIAEVIAAGSFASGSLPVSVYGISNWCKKSFDATALEEGRGGAGLVEVVMAAKGLEAEREVDVEATVDGGEGLDILRRFDALGGAPSSVILGSTCSTMPPPGADT